MVSFDDSACSGRFADGHKPTASSDFAQFYLCLQCILFSEVERAEVTGWLRRLSGDLPLPR